MISTRNEDLKVGDAVKLWYGVHRIILLDPYRGPLSHIIFAVAEVDIGGGFSLEKGGYTDVIDIPSGTTVQHGENES
jgi:hypothetical protein